MIAEFVDTNVLVYAHDPTTREKHAAARRLVERLWEGGGGCLSAQVLLEFFAVVTRKIPRPLAPERAVEIVEDYGVWWVHAPGSGEVAAAARLASRARLSIWDAMIVHSAQASGAAILWTEDLSDGQRFDPVRIRNPFIH